MELDEEDLELLGGSLRSNWSETIRTNTRRMHADLRKDRSRYTHAREKRALTRRLNKERRRALIRKNS